MTPRRIVVATDFQQLAARALDIAATIALACGAELILVHAYDVPPLVYADPPFLPTTDDGRRQP